MRLSSVPLSSLVLLSLAASARAQLAWKREFSLQEGASVESVSRSGAWQAVVGYGGERQVARRSSATGAVTVLGPGESAPAVADDGSAVVQGYGGAAWHAPDGTAVPVLYRGLQSYVSGYDAATGTTLGYDSSFEPFLLRDGTFSALPTQGLAEGETFSPTGLAMGGGAYGVVAEPSIGPEFRLRLAWTDGDSVVGIETPAGALLVAGPRDGSPDGEGFFASYAQGSARFLQYWRRDGAGYSGVRLDGYRFASGVLGGRALLVGTDGGLSSAEWDAASGSFRVGALALPDFGPDVDARITGAWVTEAGYAVQFGDQYRESSYWTARPVPEPASLAALGLGLGALARRRRAK